MKDGRALRPPSGRAIDGATNEIEALKIGNDRQNGGIERQRSARRCRPRTLRRLPGVGSRAGHADYAACVAFRLGPRPSITSRCSTVRSPL